MNLKSLLASMVMLALLVFAAPASAQDEGLPGFPPVASPEQKQDAPQPATPGSLEELLQLLAQAFVQQQQLTPADLEDIYRQVWERVGSIYHDPAALNNWGAWEHKYDGKLNKPEDLEAALQEMLGSLNDRWTKYVSTAEIQQARNDARSGVVPLGFELKQEADGSWSIDYLMYGSPAQASDLRRGDKIESINGKALKGMARADVEKLTKGRAGTKARIVYRADGKSTSLDLTFAATADATVQSRMLPGNILYVRLPDFSSELVIAEFMQAIADLHKQSGGKVEGMVLDMRGNPGGQFQLAILVSSLFLEKGTIVTGTTRSGRMVSHESYEVIPYLPHMLAGVPDAETRDLLLFMQKVPLTVLVDGSTASAAEIVTGALKDNGRATIVGNTTYGKGVGYVRSQLPVGGVLLVTTLDYLTPSGFNLSSKGIAPNKSVDQPRGSQVDEQLNAGVKDVKDQVLNPVKDKNQQKMGSDRTGQLRHVIRITILCLLLLLLIRMRRSR